MTENPNKKFRTLWGAKPSMAEVVKWTNTGHVVGIYATDEQPSLTEDKSDLLLQKLTEAHFSEDDISKLKFENPSFEGDHLCLICQNTETKDWVMKTVPNLKDLWAEAEFNVIEIGPPSKLIRSSIVMPAQTHEPAVLFSIIKAQLRQNFGNTSPALRWKGENKPGT